MVEICCVKEFSRFVIAFILPTRLHRLGYLASWSEKESRMMRSLTLILKTLGYSLNVFADSSWNLNACYSFRGPHSVIKV
jgi:hypothetical protein